MTDALEENEIQCPNPDCRAGTGARYVQVGEETQMLVGNIRIDSMSGHCAKCGRQLYFSSTQVKLDKLLERRTRKRKTDYWG